jgi:hypothetical protein
MIVSQFKIKPDRQKYTVNKDTLDTSHKKKINSFTEKEKKLDKMKQKLSNLEKKLEYLNINVSNVTDFPSKKSELSQKISDLSFEIEQIESYTDELEYLSTVQDVVFGYYGLYDNQDNKQQYSHQAMELSMNDKDDEFNSESSLCSKRKNDSDVNSVKYEKKKSKDVDNINNKENNCDNNENVLENMDEDDDSEDSELENIIAKSFDKLSRLNKCSHKKRKEKKETKKRVKLNTKINVNKKDIFSYIDPNNEVKKNNNNSKASYFRQYDILLNGSTNDKSVSRMCETCNVEEQMIYNEGIYVCPKCAKTDNCIIESEITNYKDPMVEKTTFPYDRKNHFREWVSQLQAKESKEIPKIVFDSIKRELKKYRKLKLCYTDIEYMKTILKKLKLSAYYDHVFYIISVINKEPPPNIDRETEETLYKMFDMIQEPFERHCPKNRINFISYGFILNRFFQLIGKSEYMKYFPLLKSRTKQRQQDSIWRNICKDLGWKYYPSG